MNPAVFALLSRSLRVETRARSTYALRAGLLLVVFCSLFVIQQSARFGMLGSPGKQFFETLLQIDLWFITMAALGYFASAITEEKEEMMLGLLRMTRLNALSILLGKSTSRLVGALLLLLAQVPFTTLAVTLGGVTLWQIAAGYLALLSYLFLLANGALFFSVVCRRTWAAAFCTGVAVAALWFGPGVLVDLVQSLARLGLLDIAQGLGAQLLALAQALTALSTPRQLGVLMSTGYSGPLITFQVWGSLLLGAAAFLLAWAVFEIATREQHDDAPSRGLGLAWLGGKRRRGRLSARVVGPAAVMWKDFRLIGGGATGAVVKFLAFGSLVVGLVFLANYPERPSREDLGGALFFGGLLATALASAVDAARVFQQEVRWKTLSTLMILPMPLGVVARRKVAGTLLGILPFASYMLIGALVVPDEVAETVGDILNPANHGAVLGLFLAVAQFLCFLHLVAFLSLVVKRGALPLAFAIQYAGGWFLLMPGFFVVSLLHLDETAVFTLLALLFVVLTIALHLGVGARLRRLAAEE